MPELSLALALQDYVPVAVSAVGWWFVVRIATRQDPDAGRWAAVGAVLVVAAGLSRATWKLVVAVDGPDIGPLHGALYPLLATGFLTLAAALVSLHRRQPVGRSVRWLPLAALIALALVTVLLGAGSGRAVPVLWLGAATVGSVVVGILLALRARRSGRELIALLFVVGIGATFLLNGLARLPDQSEAVQWAAQVANTLNQLVFTLAAWRLWIAESSSPSVPAARDVAGDARATRAP